MACPKHLKCPPFRSQNLKSLRAGSEAPGTRVIQQMLFFPPGGGGLEAKAANQRSKPTASQKPAQISQDSIPIL